MANFQAHLTGGALVAGTAAFASFGEGLSNSAETQALFVVGTAASLLPDIDADDSKPAHGIFNLVGVVAGFLVAFALAGRVGLIEQVFVWLGVAALIAFPVRWAFAKMTVHRGIWHSLLMAIVVALAATVAAESLLVLSPRLAWLTGAFVLLGYLAHLVLDEVASVDLLDRRVKRSFGTALKPLSLRAWPWSIALLGLAAVLLGSAPDPEPMLAVIERLGLSTEPLLGAIERLGLSAEPLLAHWPRW